jgi:pSer/pThr/pTyr-binding forkhead associated (FHA) protein
MSAATANSEAWMAVVAKVPGGRSDEPPAHLVVGDDGLERSVPIFDQLFVGRECAGISESRRLVIDDPEISRTHLEIRLDTAADQAFVIDTSSNGTRVNDVRIERAVLLPIKPGDEIRIGDVVLIFRSRRFTAVKRVAAKPTRARFDMTPMVMVVGDIVNYSTISQVTDEGIMARSLHTLWHQLGDVLRAHHGTLNYYAGDAPTSRSRFRRLGPIGGGRLLQRPCSRRFSDLLDAPPRLTPTAYPLFVHRFAVALDDDPPPQAEPMRNEPEGPPPSGEQ